MSLPTGYTEVQYIQSTGTQCIDTDFIPNQDTRIDILVMPLSIADVSGADGFTPYGAGESYTSRAFECYNANAQFEFNYGNSYGFLGSPTINSIVYISHNKNNIKVSVNSGAELTQNLTLNTFTAPRNLLLFAIGRASRLYGKVRIYSCQIYDNGSLIRDFIPCINPDGETGLYDTVNSKFYGNAGTGVFLAGPRKVTLPSSYTQLEYILASGTQYIDTGIAINSQTFDKLEFECDSLYPSLTSSNYLVHGCSGSGVIFYFGLNSTNGTVVYGPGTSDQVTSYRAVADTRYRIVFSPWSKTYVFGGNAPVTIAPSSPSGNSNFCLFGFNNGANCQAHSERLYSFKIRMNGILIRDFIPCINAAGAIGLYDLVNSKFYANAGTGVFIAGPEVTWPSDDAIYVKVNGIWRQIDGIKLL